MNSIDIFFLEYRLSIEEVKNRVLERIKDNKKVHSAFTKPLKVIVKQHKSWRTDYWKIEIYLR